MAEATVVEALRVIITIGASLNEQITWRDGAGVLVPLPAGTTAEACVRPSLYDDDILLRFETTPGPTDGLITLIDPGVTMLSLTHVQTATLSPITDAVFDIRYAFPTGEVVVKLGHGQGLMDFRLPSTRP